MIRAIKILIKARKVRKAWINLKKGYISFQSYENREYELLDEIIKGVK